MRTYLAALYCMIAVANAAAEIPDFWARLQDAKLRPNEMRIVALELRFGNSQTIGIQELPHDWIASVQKSKDGIFSVELVAANYGSAVARPQTLLSSLAICPELDSKDEDSVVEFIDGDLTLIVHGNGQERIDHIKIKKSDLRLIVDTKAIAAHRKPIQSAPAQRP